MEYNVIRFFLCSRYRYTTLNDSSSTVKIAGFIWTPCIHQWHTEVTCKCLTMCLLSTVVHTTDEIASVCLFQCIELYILCFLYVGFQYFIYVAGTVCIYPTASVSSIQASLLCLHDDLYFSTESADYCLWWCTVQSFWCTERDICLLNLWHFYCILGCNCVGKLLFNSDARIPVMFLILFYLL